MDLQKHIQSYSSLLWAGSSLIIQLQWNKQWFVSLLAVFQVDVFNCDCFLSLNDS